MAAASEGWAAFASTTVPGNLDLWAAAGDHGPWFLAPDHGRVVEAIGFAPTAMPEPGLARYSFPDLGALYGVLPRIYALSASLFDAPLQQFVAQVRSLSRTTEAEQLAVQRVGQDIFAPAPWRTGRAAAPSHPTTKPIWPGLPTRVW